MGFFDFMGGAVGTLGSGVEYRTYEAAAHAQYEAISRQFYQQQAQNALEQYITYQNNNTGVTYTTTTTPVTYTVSDNFNVTYHPEYYINKKVYKNPIDEAVMGSPKRSVRDPNVEEPESNREWLNRRIKEMRVKL